MYRLFLDDLREVQNHYPDQDFVVLRSCDEAIEYVKEHGIPAFISFDHDLGDEVNVPEKTGHTFAKFLVQHMLDLDIQEPFQYYIHSANPVGAENIAGVLDHFFEYLRKK